MNCTLENLESRTLFAITLKAGVLTYMGSDAKDQVVIDQTATAITVQYGVAGTKKSFPLAKVKTINMFGLGGNDLLTQRARVTRPGKVDGGAGDDLVMGGRGRNVLIGGAGKDMVGYVERTEDLTLTLDGRANDGRAGENDIIGNDIEMVMGGRGDDRIIGGNHKIQALFGGPGNDTLVGGSGQDVLVGADGNDSLLGGANSDILMGGAGDDVLDGGAGEDLLKGENGRDTIRSRDNVRDVIDGGLDPTIYDRDTLDILPTAPRRGVKM
jgi:Ca2+-binding RTX toxin-like protein